MTDQQPSTVLVIDDDEAIRELIELTLTDEGYRVITAGGGEQALKIIPSEHPDLILVDNRMPGMSGAEFAEHFRTLNGTGQKIPLIALTAVAEPRAAADEMGARGWIAKPFDLEELISTVSKHMYSDCKVSQ